MLDAHEIVYPWHTFFSWPTFIFACVMLLAGAVAMLSCFMEFRFKGDVLRLPRNEIIVQMRFSPFGGGKE